MEQASGKDNVMAKDTGKWIDGWICGVYICSECGKDALEIQEWGYKSNYCPHCGAKMENSDETE